MQGSGKQMVNLHNISVYNFLQANLHESLLEDNEDSIEIPPAPDEGSSGFQTPT